MLKCTPEKRTRVLQFICLLPMLIFPTGKFSFMDMKKCINALLRNGGVVPDVLVPRTHLYHNNPVCFLPPAVLLTFGQRLLLM